MTKLTNLKRFRTKLRQSKGLRLNWQIVEISIIEMFRIKWADEQ